MTQDVALGVSSCMIRRIIGALCMLYAQCLELLGVAGTMLSNERGPLLLQKSETDESLSSAVLKHAFIGEIWACRYERHCCSVLDLVQRCFIAGSDCCPWHGCWVCRAGEREGCLDRGAGLEPHVGRWHQPRSRWGLPSLGDLLKP